MSKIHCWEKFPGIYYAPDILQGLEEVEEKFLWSRGCHGLLKRCKIRVSEIWGWCNGRINNFWGKGKGWVTVLVSASCNNKNRLHDSKQQKLIFFWFCRLGSQSTSGLGSGERLLNGFLTGWKGKRKLAGVSSYRSANLTREGSALMT